MTVKRYSTGEIATKSKERVRKNGEVYTPTWVVKQMCDMLEKENAPVSPWSPEKTILEPTCGNGQFLDEIVRRRMNYVREHDLDVLDALVSLSNTWGADLLQDNVEESRERCYDVFCEFFGYDGTETSARAISKAWEIVNLNIVQMNFLTKRAADGELAKVYRWILTGDQLVPVPDSWLTGQTTLF